MAQTDLQLLLEMGFDQSRAELAVKKTGGRRSIRPPEAPGARLVLHMPTMAYKFRQCVAPHRTTVQGALEWLEANQDKPLEELQGTTSAAAADEEEDEAGGANIASVDEGESAQSLVCNECGKRFRNSNTATFHATKS